MREATENTDEGNAFGAYFLFHVTFTDRSRYPTRMRFAVPSLDVIAGVFGCQRRPRRKESGRGGWHTLERAKKRDYGTTTVRPSPHH